jgi:hypothetical protein
LRPSSQRGSAATFESVIKAAKAAEKYAAISPWGTISFVTFLCGEQRKVNQGAGAESPATFFGVSKAKPI